MTQLSNNPDFEIDTSHWFTTGATITRTTAEHHAGVASASIVTTGSAQNQGAINEVAQAVGPGDPLTVRIWAKGSGKVKVWASTVLGVYQDVFKSSEVTLSGTWQQIEASGVASLSATDVRAEIRTSDEVAAQAVTFYIDDVQLLYGTLTGQVLLADADLATTGWATAPLFSKINDSSDATVITATAS